MFKKDNFTYLEFLCLFLAQDIHGNNVYYIVNELRWHNAIIHAIELYRKTPRFVKGVYSFTNEQDALNKAKILLLEIKIA